MMLEVRHALGSTHVMHRPASILTAALSVLREETCEQAAVLHYTYNRFEDLKSRRDRCDCAPTEDDAKRCFILPFDRSVSQGQLLCAIWQLVCVCVLPLLMSS